MTISLLDLTKAKILVVDDQPENLHLLSDALTAQGYEVKGVVNGEMALIAANAVCPDLILLDVVMPGINGYEVCEKLKANIKTQSIPIIFLSASNDPVERVKGLSAGGVDYIDKPFQLNEVLLRISNQLKLQASQTQVLKLNTDLEQIIQQRTKQLELTNQELKFEISERKQVTKMLQESEEKLESILNSLEEVVWSAEVATNNLIFLNPAAQKVYGRQVEELLNNPNLRLESIHPEDRDRISSLLTNLSEGNLDLEYRIVQPNGQIRWVWERSKLIFNQPGVASRRDGIISDITQRKKIESELCYEAKHDSLTRLPNRSAFLERVEQALQYSKKTRDYIFAVLFIDLDRFKIVNDSLGHLIGDELLIAVAQILNNCCRPNDFVARLGGDEFTILLNQIATIEESSNIAHKIQTQLSNPFYLQGHSVFTSASIGIVEVNHEYEDSSAIIRNADIAMYRAKQGGKARYQIFNPQMYQDTKESLEIENDLRQAILRQEFILYYQPIISLDNHKLYGFEALLRWQHPTKGLIYPDKFIPLAEETGLIIKMGEWVLKEACTQLHLWQTKYSHLGDLKVSVNIASQQLKNPNFLSILERTLAETGVSSNSIHLEITESALMDYKPETINLLHEIQNRGIKLNIDDFGTGYSSLQYLKRFPISSLKIDRSFTSGMLQERENFEIVKMIITLARTLKIGVIAEGIENLKQLKVLKTFNCQLGQGHLFSEAVDATTAESMLS